MKEKDIIKIVEDAFNEEIPTNNGKIEFFINLKEKLKELFETDLTRF